MSLLLSRPSLSLFDAWSEAVLEFGDERIHGSGMDYPTVADRPTCAALVARAELVADTQRALPDDAVHNDLYWMTEADRVVGFLSIRHELNEFLREVGGHIGYSVRPADRRKGYASRGLQLALARAREIGLTRAMVTCDDDNVGSARVIEKAGGQLQDVVDRTSYGYPLIRRYWIDL